MQIGRAAKVGMAVAVALSGTLLAMWVMRPAASAGPCVLLGGPAMLPELPETSGLAVSRQTPALLWSHNDSGNAAVLFAFDAAGNIRGQVRVPIRLRDWEDISAGRCPSGDCLYLADIGDNSRQRQHVEIYRVPEPAPADAETAQPEVFNATYPDGPHNAEALFVIGDELFIVTRDRVGAVYRAAIGASGNRALTLQRIGQLGLEAVTDAEASRDESTVVVRTSHEALFYKTTELIAGGTVPYLRVPLDALWEAQGEGVAIDGNRLYLSSEGSRWQPAGRLLTLQCPSTLIAD